MSEVPHTIPTMGMIGRLLIPRSARKLMNPMSAIGGAVMPRPVKQLRRATFAMTNPVGAIGGAVEDLVVETLRPRAGRRRRSSGGRPTARGSDGRVAEIEECALDNAALKAVMELHRDPGQAATRPIAAAPEAVDQAALLKRHRKEAVKGLRLWKLTERREARDAAAIAAEQDALDEKRRRQRSHDRQQAELDASWKALREHDPSVVVRALSDSFDSSAYNLLDSAAGIASAKLFVDFPGIELVPDRSLGTTPTGRPTLRKRSKTTRNEMYADALASFVLAVARRAFNVLPGASTVSVVALRETEPSFEHPEPGFMPIAHCEMNRRDLSALNEDADPVALFEYVGGRLKQKGRTKEIVEIRFEDPELQEFVDVFKLPLERRRAKRS